MWLHASVVILHVLGVLVHVADCVPGSALEEVNSNIMMRAFSSLVQRQNMSHLLERTGITVFVPVSTSYDQFEKESRKYGYDLNDPNYRDQVVQYHIAEGVTMISDMKNHSRIKTFHPAVKYLHFNSFNYGDTQVYTVSGSMIISGDIMTDNGVIHILDRFLTPLQSSKTIAQYLEKPDIPNLAFKSILAASIIDVPLKEATNSTAQTFTVFSPNDSYIMTMPAYGQDELFKNIHLLKSVFWAHVIENQTMFVPRLGEISEMQAKAGIIKYYRMGNDVYVSNNKVRARIVQSNIPVANGVIHVIDDLLFYIYRNFRQKIEVIPNAHFIHSILSKVENDLQVKLEDILRRMTFFLPTDDAFAKIPSDKQMQLDQNQTLLTKLILDHIVMYGERDISSFQDGETLTTGDDEIITIRRIQKDVYVEGGAIKAKITVPDIGCTNGVIHLISNVLFQRDFTIWDAIRGNSQLSKMRDVLNDNVELRDTLSYSPNPLTVFLISNAAYNDLPDETKRYLQVNSHRLIKAIRGSIADGVILSSTQISESMDVRTLDDTTITLYNTNQGLYIIGSKIRANVVINDIWCSNGILHVTDNILHLPTRTIVDEIALHPGLTTMKGIIRTFPDLTRKLSNISRTFTMFVPSDDAFTYLPAKRANKFQTNPRLLVEVVNAHVVPGMSLFLEQYEDYTSFPTEKGNSLFLVKNSEKASVISSNVKGTVLETNIRCMNGMIHIIDTLLDFPFWSVSDVIHQTPELTPFYMDILQKIDEFHSWSSMDDIQQTLFVPSAKFFNSLSDDHKTTLLAEPGMARKIFESHFLPGILLTQSYLSDMFKSSKMYVTENRYNVTFNLLDRDNTGKTELASVDVGYYNLREMFDLVKDGIACSNGIIYIINGFLNYPLNDIPTEIRRQPEISIGADQLLKLIPKNSTINLSSTDTVFTVFVPSDDSFSHLTLNDINYINKNISYNERMEIIRRHVVRGYTMTYEDILNGRFTYYAGDHNMSIIPRTDAIYVKWFTVEAKIKNRDILATNGVIHVIDRLLLSTPYQTTTTTTTTIETTKIQRVSASRASMTSSVSCALVMLCYTIGFLSKIFLER